MKKIAQKLSLLLAFLLLSTTTAFAANIPADIVGTTHEEAIKTLIEAGAITGDTDGQFHPDAQLTRAQACIILVKTIDPPASMVNGTPTQSVTKTAFSDLSGYSWAEGYISYAVEQGIVKGYPDGTFKPGANVSTNEMLTMILRAAGYTESTIGANWPTDYIAKAKEIGILNNVDEAYPEKATKGIAAQMTFNQMTKLQAMAPTEEGKPQGTEKDRPENLPSTSGMTFATGSFDNNMTTFAGKAVSKGVDIYIYGLKSEYSKDMSFSDKADDYRKDTLYKFKDVKTPAWYLEEDGKIIKMILPQNVGFSGYVCAVVNGVITDVNGEGDSVAGFETLTATKAITWFGKKGLTAPNIEPGNGQLYELRTSDGEVQSVAPPAATKSKRFVEFTDKEWTEVTEYSDKVITIDKGLISVKTNASIYVWDDKKSEYRQGNLSSIKAGKEIRAYDTSDDDVQSADVVIIK
ncbi:S-layer homology domain-containing protein [Aminipila butyrica]|uniref:S-layer homology domain-containing protein n=1 Tax=Aminipila butyrica TaxID=433296 RepID=A0A858BQP4_9FIRM|nr:S-layer homology domain-containing protein [Aminipila butyrica]QIB68143.1 S-layer homology domain-containing protein [Aminipila butyrica]